MPSTKNQFVCDDQGNRTGVLVELQRYRELLEAEEELEAVRAYDAAKASDDEVVPFDQAVMEIETTRA